MDWQEESEVDTRTYAYQGKSSFILTNSFGGIHTGYEHSDTICPLQQKTQRTVDNTIVRLCPYPVWFSVNEVALKHVNDLGSI